MATPIEWGHVAHRALATRAYPPDPVHSWRGMPGMGGPVALNMWELSAPGAALYRHALGQDEPPPAQLPETAARGILALGIGTIVVLVIVAGAINYQIGSAMAPDRASRSKWGWGNAILGTIFPPFTLGAAIYKNYFRD